MRDALIVGVGDAGINMAWAIAKCCGAHSMAVHEEFGNSELHRYVEVHMVEKGFVSNDESFGGAAVVGALREAFSRHKSVALIAGLGGRTAGKVPILAELALASGVETTVLATMPFQFEGRDRRREAERQLAELRSMKIQVVVEENDDLVALGRDVNMANAFNLMTNTIAGRWQGMYQTKS